MTSTLTYIKQWQKAIQVEIHHLKKYGSTKYRLTNGRLINKDAAYTYYFDTLMPVRVPVGSNVKVEWGATKVEGRILSSEGKSVIVALNGFLGDLVTDLFLLHDPWELLDQLFERLGEMKESKRKRTRIKQLMDPSYTTKHPTDNIKSNVHELILRSKYNPVTFVWGPPGTGKTYTLARVTANKYFQEKQVLVLAHSNQAVDVLMAEISTFIKKKERFREGDLLRYGSQVGGALVDEFLTTSQLIGKHHPDLAVKKEELVEERRLIKQDLSKSFSVRDSDRLLEIETKLASVLEKVRQKEIEFVKDADIIGTTLAKAANDPTIYEKEFDLVVLDEASMAYIPQIGFAVSLAKRAIICGDFKQLPPIAAARHVIVDEWMREDIFHKSGVVTTVNGGELHPQLFLLNEQRRMHPDISSFTNKYIYHSLVGDHESVRSSRNAIVASAPFPNLAAVLLDSSYTGLHCIREQSSQSRMNVWHLLLSFQLIHEAYVAGNRSIGYITPYRAQAILMEHLLTDLYEKELQSADIISATVHRFQGSERDVMIFDTVDSYPQERVGMLLIGKESERLLNVAITRTKGKFIHVSDKSYIRKHVYSSKILRKLVEHQIQQNQVVSPREIGTWVKNQHPRLKWVHAKKTEQVFEDLRLAKSIVISIPSNCVLTKEWIDILENRDCGIKLIIITENVMETLKSDERIRTSLPFPFVMIDKRFVWLGQPLTEGVNLKPPYVSVRLDSKVIAEHLLTSLPLEQ